MASIKTLLISEEDFGRMIKELALALSVVSGHVSSCLISVIKGDFRSNGEVGDNSFC